MNEPFSQFVDEINFDDLNLLEIVGRGAFGTVQRAEWLGKIVAIKISDMSGGVKEYQNELENLSQVRHENIIRLFGTSINKHKVFIVMEYAECGSLHNLLHPAEPEKGLVRYNLGHVFNWCLQSAQAVEYLHSLQPKVIHRDLKSPNMLLLEHGKVIKICDFGTSTKIHTEMTSTKGSAAWMAPEVFEGKRYSEKCDVYSFGIVLWEMLSRKKPFDEIGPPAFRILWAVYSGTRPPPLQNIPESLHKMMDSCWLKDQSKRPSFTEIVSYFREAEKLVPNVDDLIFDYDECNYYEDDAFGSIRTEGEVSPNWKQDNILPDTPLDTDISTAIPVESPLPKSFHPPLLHNQSIDFNQISSMSPSGSSNNTPLSGFKKSPDNWPISEIVNADWSLVPQHLMPIKPIKSVEVSIKMYDNYNEALKKYIDIQTKIKDLKIQKENLERQIKEVDKEQKNNALYLERYLKLDNDKSNLLEHHRAMKSTLENAHQLNRNKTRSHISHSP